CMDLCDLVLDWTAEQLSCIGQVVRLAGYAPGAAPQCRLIRSPQECLDCSEALGLTENICRGATFICLP
ncbi:MAG: hypothetical protein WCF10_08395, partial [Polyangiales bacterium]